MPSSSSEAESLSAPSRPLNLAPVAEAGASADVAALYQRYREEFGRPNLPGILQCFATHPPLLAAMMDIAKSILFTDGALGRQTKEAIATFVSSRNRCEYCADSHGYFLREHGGSADYLAALTEREILSPAIEPRMAALLAFAGKVTESSDSIHPRDVETLREFGWTELQIAETIHLAALFACFNRVVNAFGLPSQGMLAMRSWQEKA